MMLPNHILDAISRLESAGFAAYAVGGCVRDHVLGLQPADYDLSTSALPEQIRQVFSDHRLVLAGIQHGTVSVVTDFGLVEITTFRTEGGYGDTRHPDWVQFVDDIELDLSRRDFTVNAMAFSPTRGFADPFGGREDLANGVLRCVGQPQLRFQEDALRILRGVRFASRYRLTLEEKTREAMFLLTPLLNNLAWERVFDELCKLLPTATAEDLLTYAPVLAQVVPELADCIGFQQRTPYHQHDVYTHTAHVVAALPPDVALRLAGLLHDIGKPTTFTLDDGGVGHFPDHARVSADMADAALRRLRASNSLRNRVVGLILHHMTPLTAEEKLLRRRLNQFGPEGVKDLLALQRADHVGKGPGADLSSFDGIQKLLTQLLESENCFRLKDLAVNGQDLLDLGFHPGKPLGSCLQWLLEQVLEQALPNEKTALLEAASRFPQRNT